MDIIGEEALDGYGRLSIKTVDEQRFEYGSFKQNVVFSCRRGRCARRRGGRIPEFLLSLAFRGGIFVRRGICSRSRGCLEWLPGFRDLRSIDLSRRGRR